ncbi:MAG: hypothetical protein KDA86_21880 [Planctomycetaceae bacterium]|nr:hypothetical protein [Planctomycetaceae bacterium]MCA9109431.1 hypothetical protein [Planctomycetaceae bacterium]
MSRVSFVLNRLRLAAPFFAALCAIIWYMMGIAEYWSWWVLLLAFPLATTFFTVATLFWCCCVEDWWSRLLCLLIGVPGLWFSIIESHPDQFVLGLGFTLTAINNISTEVKAPADTDEERNVIAGMVR